MPRRPKDWDEPLWHLADQLSGGNAILVLHEISWLGRSDPMFSTRLWAPWEETPSHLDNFVLVLSGPLPRCIDDRFSSNTGDLGRISRNMTLDELLVRDALGFFGARRSRIAPRGIVSPSPLGIDPSHDLGDSSRPTFIVAGPFAIG